MHGALELCNLNTDFGLMN